MIFIILKFLLAVILTSIPFIYRYVVKPKSEKNKALRNIFTAIQFYIVRKFIHSKKYKRLIHFRDGMKIYKSFRKFFVLILFLILICVQFVDMNLPVRNAPSIFFQHDISAAFPAALITFPFFSYRFANYILLKIKKSFLFSPLFIVIVVGLSYIANFFILSETLYIIMLASVFYPYFTPGTNPRSKKGIPVSEKLDKMAA